MEGSEQWGDGRRRSFQLQNSNLKVMSVGVGSFALLPRLMAGRQRRCGWWREDAGRLRGLAGHAGRRVEGSEVGVYFPASPKDGQAHGHKTLLYSMNRAAGWVFGSGVGWKTTTHHLVAGRCANVTPPLQTAGGYARSSCLVIATAAVEGPPTSALDKPEKAARCAGASETGSLRLQRGRWKVQAGLTVQPRRMNDSVARGERCWQPENARREAHSIGIERATMQRVERELTVNRASAR